MLESHRPFSEDNRQGFFPPRLIARMLAKSYIHGCAPVGASTKRMHSPVRFAKTTGPPEGARRGAWANRLDQEVLQGKGKARKGKGKNVEGKGKVWDAAAETALTSSFSTQCKGGQDVQPAMAWPSLETTGYESLLQFATYVTISGPKCCGQQCGSCLFEQHCRNGKCTQKCDKDSARYARVFGRCRSRTRQEQHQSLAHSNDQPGAWGEPRSSYERF